MTERAGKVSRRRRDFDSDLSGEDGSTFDSLGGRRRGRGLTSLLALAISGVVLYVAWCVLWERNHPASSAARGIKKGDAAARLRAIAELERLGPQDPEVALPALIGGLADPEPGNRAAAAEALVTVIQGFGVDVSDLKQVHAAVSAVMGRLEDPNALVRARAAQALWMIVMLWQGSPRVLDLDAIAAAEGEAACDADAEVRLAGVRGLGVVGQRLAEDPPPKLVAALEDESEAVRSAAAQAIVTYHRGLVRLLPALVKSLEAARPEYRPAYFSVLKQAGPSVEPEEAAKAAIPALISALGSRDREVRHHVIVSLGEFGPEARAAIPALLAILAEPDEAGSSDSEKERLRANDPVVAAAGALREMARNSSRVVEPMNGPMAGEVTAALTKRLRSPNPRRRAAAAAALGQFPLEAVQVEHLNEAAGDRDVSVRVAALEAIHAASLRARFPMPTALPKALEDQSPEVRKAAVLAIRHVGAELEQMVPTMIRHAGHDPDAEVRGICLKLLGDLEPPEVTAAVVPIYIEALDSRESPAALRRTLIEALPRFGAAAHGAVPAIVRALRFSEEKDARPNTGMMEFMNRSAGRRSGPIGSTFPRLSEGATLKEWAASALGELAPGTPSAPEAVVALTDALDDPVHEVSWAAVRALIAFGPAARAAAPELLRILQQARDKKSAWNASQFADAVRTVAPGTPEEEQALAVLIELIDVEPRLRFIEMVIDVVARFGPRAARAVPRLRELEKLGDERVRDAARKAVAALEGSVH